MICKDNQYKGMLIYTDGRTEMITEYKNDYTTGYQPQITTSSGTYAYWECVRECTEHHSECCASSYAKIYRFFKRVNDKWFVDDSIEQLQLWHKA